MALSRSSIEEIKGLEDPWIGRLLLKNKVKETKEYDLGEFFHIALWRELSKAAGCQDKTYLDEFMQGMPIVGEVAKSGRWPPLPEVKTFVPPENLEKRAWEIRKRVVQKM